MHAEHADTPRGLTGLWEGSTLRPIRLFGTSACSACIAYPDLRQDSYFLRQRPCLLLAAAPCGPRLSMIVVPDLRAT
jgi:hypothetical protein